MILDYFLISLFSHRAKRQYQSLYPRPPTALASTTGQPDEEDKENDDLSLETRLKKEEREEDDKRMWAEFAMLFNSRRRRHDLMANETISSVEGMHPH